MKFLSGVIALGCSIWLHIYLYGLEVTSEAKFNKAFYLYALILFVISIYSFYSSFKNRE